MAENQSPNLLIIEDDEARAKRCEQMAKAAGWTPVVAGSLEKAVELAEQHHASIRLLLIDNMVPETESDLGECRRLQKERSDLSVPIVNAMKRTEIDTQAAADLEAQMIAIDSTWRFVIADDGGLRFLDNARGAGWLKRWSYLVFSATSQVRGEALMQEWEILPDPNYCGWLTKPMDDAMVETFLQGKYRKLMPNAC